MSVYNGITQRRVRGRGDRSRIMIRDERGIALISVMMVMLMVTVLGIAALVASGLGNSMAGLQRTMTESGQAAESCLGTGANVLLQTLLPESGSEVPAALLAPTGPVPTTTYFSVSNPDNLSNPVFLGDEIIGQPENSIDVASGVGPTGGTAAPNIQMMVGNYTVVGDIDRLYVKPRAGSGQQQNAAYDGAGVGAGANGIDIFYRITCTATNMATGMESQVSSLYACAFTGDGCQKQP